MFNQLRRIEYSQLAPDKTVTIPDMLRFLQDIAVAHTTACGYPLEKLEGLNRAWILLSTHLVLRKPISFPADIQIQTWTFDFSKVSGPRAFVIKDCESGEEYASACSMWTFVDTESGSPKQILDDIISVYGNGPTAPVSYIRRSPSFDSCNHFKDFQILKRDLDSNFHVNNVKYIEYALETVTDNFLVKEVEVFYRHPVYLGETISLFTDKNEDGDILVNIKNQAGETCTYVKFVVEKKADTE